MALNIPQFGIPTSLVFNPRDYSQQIANNQAADTRGLQNAFKFGTQIYDTIKNRQIAEEMNQENPDYKKIDSLAAQRINNPDTSFGNWRWKQGQDQAMKIHDLDLARVKAEKEAANELAAKQVFNKVTNTLGSIKIGPDTTPDQAQQYRNTLAGLRTEAQSVGNQDLVDAVDAKINELNQGTVEERANDTTDLETLLNNPNLSLELIDKFEARNPNLSREDWGRLDNKRAELTNKANKQKEAARYEAARKKLNISKERWNLLSKEKRKAYVKQAGV